MSKHDKLESAVPGVRANRGRPVGGPCAFWLGGKGARSAPASAAGSIWRRRRGRPAQPMTVTRSADAPRMIRPTYAHQPNDPTSNGAPFCSTRRRRLARVAGFLRRLPWRAGSPVWSLTNGKVTRGTGGAPAGAGQRPLADRRGSRRLTAAPPGEAALSCGCSFPLIHSRAIWLCTAGWERQILASKFLGGGCRHAA